MKAIVIGSSTGIGFELAKTLDEAGYALGICGRNVEKMQRLSRELRRPATIEFLDLQNLDEAAEALRRLIQKMEEVDLIVINSGVGGANYDLDWQKEKLVIDVNVAGFTRMMIEAFNYFEKRGGGKIAAVSSIAGLRGFWHSPSYNASKAYMSNYMQAMRSKAAHLRLPIVVTDIVPGFVLTPLTEGKPSMFWVASAQKAARQIYAAIDEGKNYVYVTRRWRIVGWVMKLFPETFLIWAMNRAKRRQTMAANNGGR